MAKRELRELVFRLGLPHCCGKKLGNGWPGIQCPQCKTVYNADDLLENVLGLRSPDFKLIPVRQR